MDKRTHILEIAEEMFAHNGFDGTSVRELAKKAEVNLAMINYYFGSKEKLFEALIEKKASVMLGRLKSLYEDSSQNAWQKLESLIELYISRIVENQNYFLIIQRELLLDQREQFHQNILRIFEKNQEQIQLLLKDGQDKGFFKKVDPELISVTITGTIMQAFKKMTSWGIAFANEDEKKHSMEEMKEKLKTHLFEMLKSYLQTN